MRLRINRPSENPSEIPNHVERTFKVASTADNAPRTACCSLPSRLRQGRYCQLVRAVAWP